jgi:hypothetical protein
MPPPYIGRRLASGDRDPLLLVLLVAVAGLYLLLGLVLAQLAG